jgi:hypothetical protein
VEQEVAGSCPARHPKKYVKWSKIVWPDDYIVRPLSIERE